MTHTTSIRYFLKVLITIFFKGKIIFGVLERFGFLENFLKMNKLTIFKIIDH